ncbi:MAG: exo-alpha-sialidase [Clostridia bacterium]|nr:exo-alpha-sialidase [Clostridia bacterium]
MKQINTICVEPSGLPVPANGDASSQNKEKEYFRCRIPGVVALEDGGALLYYECRAGDSDWAATDIGMRRVLPDGTVGDRVILADGAGHNTMNNPVMIADGDTVHLLYCENYRRVFYRRSVDAGSSWTAAKELTDQIEAGMKGVFFNAFAVGPGHGVRLSGGRLIVPVWFAYNRISPRAHHPSKISALYSDDGGENWALGEIVDTDQLTDPSETAVAELPDGRVIVNIRNENPDKFRRTMTSRDGGLHWENLKIEKSLPDPVCCAGLCRAGDDLLFTNCEHPTERRNLTAKLLSPDGIIKEKMLLSDPAGYSDVCAFPDGRAYVFFERGRELFLEELVLIKMKNEK